MNILKTNFLTQDINYNKFYKVLNFQKPKQLLQQKALKWKFFNFKYINNMIEISVDKNIDFLTHMNFLFEYLNDEDKVLFLNLLIPKKININFTRRILTHLHTDLIILCQTIDNCHDLCLKKKLIDYLSLCTGIDYKKNYLKTSIINNQQRSNIFTVNKNSIIYNLHDGNNKFLDKLKVSTINLISENPILSFIEICDGFDEEKLVLFIKETNSICLNLHKHIGDISLNQKFSLKIRKIKRTRKKAMYIKEQNSIIIDPRHVDSFIHELGHWYHCNFLPNINTVIEAEKFAENFHSFFDNN